MKVVHVTEAFAGGVVAVLTSLANSQVASGADVTIWYMKRPNAEIDPSALGLSPEVTLKEFARTSPGMFGLWTLSQHVRRAIARHEFDVVHLHSSFAGALGRLVVNRDPRRSRVFYSPHGFSFLMLDRPAIVRFAYRLLERALAKRGDGVIVTWESEAEEARKSLGVEPVGVVHTGVARAEIDKYRGRQLLNEGRIRVGMVGRVAYQKGPWHFKVVADACPEADFVWIGGGKERDIEQWLEGIHVTGWLTPGRLEQEMQDLDVVLFPSLWEGFPISLAKAQVMGVPAVALDVIGCRDVVIDGVTGLLCASQSQLIAGVRSLLHDRSLLRAMSSRSLELAERLSDEKLADEVQMAYDGSGTRDYL
jgi:glycosyltransferase involved in cell wall biosynthesis